MSDETGLLIKRYLRAANNLYNLIPIKQIYRIIALQNPKLSLTFEDFEKFIDSIDLEKEFFYFDTFDGWYSVDNWDSPEYLMHDYLDDDELLYSLLNTQEGNLYYIPKKNGFLKHEDEYYHEDNRTAKKISDYLKKEFQMTNDIVEEVLLEITGIINAKNDIDEEVSEEIMEDLERVRVPFKVVFTDDKQKSELNQLILELESSLRIPLFRGYSEDEFQYGFNYDIEIKFNNNKAILPAKLKSKLFTNEVDCDEFIKLAYCNITWSDDPIQNADYAKKVKQAVSEFKGLNI